MKTNLLSGLLADDDRIPRRRSTSPLDAHVRGHLTRAHAVCPDGAVLCGSAEIAGYGSAE